jgi:hypothetical protein
MEEKQKWTMEEKFSGLRKLARIELYIMETKAERLPEDYYEAFDIVGGAMFFLAFRTSYRYGMRY